LLKTPKKGIVHIAGAEADLWLMFSHSSIRRKVSWWISSKTKPSLFPGFVPSKVLGYMDS
jgi:hypothetical protein